ncbi:MAG: Asp-tRNA(Asn)/Glu-tRNA(Gln) amidotransferase GatCAB subunit C, partial [Parasporobacterium sp.]|nr:Asp-tRNA(Asn)/Glu-tRNA(Gln) amidotransferase GatCAB subunit C [Parasporobacterium sp.]
MQSRTHNCNELRLSDAGKTVTLCGWLDNERKVSKNLSFVLLRDFYGTTQFVFESEEMIARLDGVNKESTLQITGLVRERENKNQNLPTGEVEVVPTDV